MPASLAYGFGEIFEQDFLLQRFAVVHLARELPVLPRRRADPR
jgi:hypothetical protein